jgi:hypothetical protein
MARKSSKKVLPFTGTQLDQAVLLLFRLKDVAQRDIDNYLISIGKKEDSSNKKFDRYNDMLNRLLSVQVSRKLELDQRSVPLYEYEDADSILADMLNALTDDDIPREQAELFCRGLKNTIINQTKINNESSEDASYQEIWLKLGHLKKILEERGINLSQIEPTVGLCDELARRQFSRDEFAAQLKKLSDTMVTGAFEKVCQDIFILVISSFTDDLTQDEIEELKEELLKDKDVIDTIALAVDKFKELEDLSIQYTLDRIYGKT